MTEADIKDAVRERDSYRCRDCGVSNDDHVERTGRQLEVHRLVPGCEYEVFWCITLCRDCHNKKPRYAENLLFNADAQSGLFVVYFNLYSDIWRRVFSILRGVVGWETVKVRELIQQILIEYANCQPTDYTI